MILTSDIIIQIEAICIKTETQVTALQALNDRSPPRLPQFHEECLRRLIAKIWAANAEVETYTDGKTEDVSLTHLSFNDSPLKKVRYALFESHLRKMVGSLQAWHAVFDSSCFLLTLRNDTTIDITLSNFMDSSGQPELGVILDIRRNIRQSQSGSVGTKSILRPEHFVTSIQDEVPHSSLAVSALRETGSQVILDTTEYPRDIDRARIFRYVPDLANILSCSHPKTLGLLQCTGLLKIFDAAGNLSQFRYIFAIPLEAKMFLRAFLLQGPEGLDIKVVIAKTNTRAILAIH